METAGTFNCQRYDCPLEKDRDCSLCDKPIVRPDVIAVLKLYRRCKQFKTLPRSGGVFEQDEDVMEMLEFVENEVETYRAKRAQDQEGEIMKKQMLKGLPRG